MIRLFYYTHFIKKERVKQWHILEKEKTVGNTASRIKLQTAHISRNQSLGLGTKSEAVQSASQAEIELSNGIVEDKDITLAEYFEKWYKVHRAPSVSTGTLKHYETATAAIVKYFQGSKLIDITPSKYQAILNEMGKHYRKSTLKVIHAKVKACAKYAVMDQIIKVNFAELAKVTSEIDPNPIEKKFLSQTEYLNLIR